MRRLAVIPLLCGALAVASVAQAQTLPQAPPRDSTTTASAKSGIALSDVNAKPWTGDFDGMVKRRVIRVLVPYSKTYYFVDRAVQRGIAYQASQLLERQLNDKLKSGAIRLRVQCIPVNRGEMISALLAGRGDFAIGNLTITPERLKQVDFTRPIVRDAVEIAVTGPSAEPIATVDELSGKEVYLRKSSSYYESIQELNALFARTGKAPVKVRFAPENLEAEDILEMVNAGLVKMTIVEDYIASFWKEIFPRLTPRTNVIVRSQGEIAWMVRKGSPKLKAELDAFLVRVEKQGLRDQIVSRYLKTTRWAKEATSRKDLDRFEQMVTLFRKYGDRYDLDYLLLMAQGYQESELRQEARSRVGAIGVMQVMPETGKSMRVGDITKIEPNIHAGTKFLRAMVNEYYAKEPIDDLNKGLFAFAAYNAGPGRISQLRRLTAQRGLDRNIWFNNVELLAAEKIGRETVTYVSNIYKYYLAYQMIQEEHAERQETKKALKTGTSN
jgi:membrane-bound lytic murein transglycosylase MltF